MPWYHKQAAELSAVCLPESSKRVLQGAIDSRVDVGALKSLNGSGPDLHDKYDTGVRDLTSQRVMVLIKASGDALSVQASRLELASRYDLSQRDLSLLDPWVPLPLPASFMVRKRAILANLGAIRLLISRCECIVLTSGRIADMYIFGEEPDISDGLTHKMQQAATQDEGQVVPGAPDMASHSPSDHSLPFELRMLDTALEEACKLLGVEVRGVVKSGKGRIKDLEMEKSSYRGSRILEELKEIRSNMGALRSRVQMLKKELEDVMEDDQDMLEMLLERKHVLSHMSALAMQTRPSAQSMPPPLAMHGLPLHAVPPGSQSPLKVPADTGAVSGVAATGAVPSSGGGLPGVLEAPSGAETPADEPEPERASSATSHRGAYSAAAQPIEAQSVRGAAGGEGITQGITQGGSQEPGLKGARQVPWLGTVEGLESGFGSMIVHNATASAAAEAEGGNAWEGRRGQPAASKTSAAPSLADRAGFASTFTSASANSSQSHVARLRAGDRHTTGSHSVLPTVSGASSDAVQSQGPFLAAAVSAPEQLPMLPSATAEPDRVPIGARMRQVSKVGQYGWGTERRPRPQSAMAAGTPSQEQLPGRPGRLSLDRRRSPHKGNVKGVRHTAGGGRGSCSEASTDGGSHSEGSSVHTVRSFTSDTEAIKLSTLKEEDPQDSAARAKYYVQMGLAPDGGPAGNSMHAHMAHAPMATGRAQQLGSYGPASSMPTGLSASGVDDSTVPDASAGLVRGASHRSSHREDLLEDLLSHMMDIKFQTAPRHQPAPVNPNDIQDVENILEAYTLQLDYYLSQLSDLSADIEEFWMDTQQDLGKKRNSLFAFQILVNTVTMGFSFVAMVAGIFGLLQNGERCQGMNLKSGVESADGWFNCAHPYAWQRAFPLRTAALLVPEGVTIISSGLAGVVTVAIMAGLHLQGMLSLKKVPAVAMS